MFNLFRKAVNVRLLIISFCVYIFVNLFENLIHYNIGKHSNAELKFELPTEGDWFKIVMVMFTFALIQGTLTCLIDDRCS
jgi:hypothetical protein